MNDIFLPDFILDIIDRFREAGYDAYVVGGAVRDELEGIRPSDYDMCTSALPEETESLFADREVIETGLKHGTVTVVTDGGPVEITTFRSDGTYSDGRHPDEVHFVKDIEEDLARRDFTVNAMAYSPYTGLVDPFAGRRDLESGILRSVGDPARRFSEDGLRILRALRFMSVRGYQPELATDKAIRSCMEMIKDVAYERIDAELLKFLTGDGAAGLLDSYRQLFALIIPEIKPMFGFDQKSPYHNRDVWHHTLAAVKNIRPDPLLRLTMLFHDIAKPVVYVEDETGRGHFKGHQSRGAEMTADILTRMKFPKAVVSEVSTLIREHDLKIRPDRHMVRKYINRLGADILRKLMDVQMADASGKYDKFIPPARERTEAVRQMIDQIEADGDCVSLGQLEVNGTDLRAAGITDGRKIGDTLRFLLDGVMEDRIPNRKEDLLKAAAEFEGES